MQQQKINFQESVLLPKILFDKLESSLKNTSHSSLEELKSEILLPADTRLKKHDFDKKFQREAKLITSVNQDREAQERRKKERQREIILHSIQGPKQTLVESILHYILTQGKGVIEWNDNFELKLQGERQFNSSIIQGLKSVVGEIGDPTSRYYNFYMLLKSIGVPPDLLLFYDSSNDPAAQGLVNPYDEGRYHDNKRSSDYSEELENLAISSSNDPPKRPRKTKKKGQLNLSTEITSLIEQERMKLRELPSFIEQERVKLEDKKKKKKGKKKTELDTFNWDTLDTEVGSIKSRLRNTQT